MTLEIARAIEKAREVRWNTKRGTISSERMAALLPTREVLRLPPGTVDTFIAAEPRLAVYRFYLKDIARRAAHTLSDAAFISCQLSGITPPALVAEESLGPLAAELARRLRPAQRYLHGLFCGGTLGAEALLLIEKPWKKPVATLAAPSPISSWLASIFWPCRAAKTRAVRISSATNCAGYFVPL